MRAEPDAAGSLAKALRGHANAKAVAIDGWTALGAYIPPKERRGLVLIDPPFEDANEFDRLPEALSAAYRKWPTGIYMLWYPIKERAAPDTLARRLRRCAISNMLRAELLFGPPRPKPGWSVQVLSWSIRLIRSNGSCGRLCPRLANCCRRRPR